MREILFRGKCLFTGEWVYGSYLPDTDTLDENTAYILTYELNDPDYVYEKVDLPTVGQYTGMKDKNGKKIFEGDVFTVSAYGWVAVVEWDEENARYLGRLTTGNICYVGREPRVEVIGNIHDNADLIE